MCTAFREAGIQLPDWVKIAKQLPVSMQLQISADEFFESWFAYTDGYQPSWVKLAQALERTGNANYKQAAGKVWNQGTYYTLWDSQLNSAGPGSVHCPVG